jgi:spore coat protein A
VAAGSTEVWEIYNTTADVHPMHFHLVDVQVLSRQQFVQDAAGLPVNDPNTGLPQLIIGTLRGPDNNERGYKETVRMNPGEVIRVIMKFDLPSVPFVIPPSPRMAQPPYSLANAHEYVWHCHILEHEEHDMMHALVVV